MSRKYNKARIFYGDGMSVYFIQCGDGGPIKIGKALNVRKRLSLLQIGSPYPLILLGVIAGGRDEEVQIHKTFGKSWIRGEWFAPSDELLAFIAAGVAPKPAQVDLTTVRGMIEAIGGTTATAKRLGIAVNTVQSWKKKNHMPSYRVQELRGVVATIPRQTKAAAV